MFVREVTLAYAEQNTIGSMHLVADRPNLSEEIADALREMIVDGRLPPGGRLNEVHLAARLGASRTPLREALGRLAAEGAVTSSPRIGFFVGPLTASEFQQIYPIRAILDPEALRLTGIPSAKRIARLDAMNKRLTERGDAESVISHDDAWHFELLSECPNVVLIELIGQFMRRTRRYEIAYMRESQNVRAATGHHQKILAALRKGDLARACDELRRNMLSGIPPVLAWLDKRDKKPSEK